MPTPLPADYSQRVYAGVLGKIIGVYLGRPFEGWPYRKLVERFGQIDRYVHEDLKVPLIVTDDDITGTFTFVRALADNPAAGDGVTAEQIGNTWLNYLIENKTILWWGGVGLSTEHTAFKRLQGGIAAPASGSRTLNGRVVSEQIGSQIFIDGWAMVAPGRPDLAAELARRAATVSHDGEAVYAAQLLAAMEAQAFIEPSIDELLNVGLGFIPADCLVRRMADELRDFRAKTDDWHKAMTDVLEQSYGYDKYGGNCHVIPNHGVILAALLYCNDSFSNALTIANTLGWDTDCNSGNVGCLMGIKNGLAGLSERYDWRGPVADRVFLPTGEGGSCASDALREADTLIAVGHRLADATYVPPKDGARFHFSQPGSVQGFLATGGTLSNPDGRLAIAFGGENVCRIETATFIPTDMQGGGAVYGMLASPTLSPGQLISATLIAGDAAITARPLVTYYDEHDQPATVFGDAHALPAGATRELTWTVPALGGQPILRVGLELTASAPCSASLDRLTWAGTPRVTLGKIQPEGNMWRRQWVESVSVFGHAFRENPQTQAFNAVQNSGRGLASHGTREWRDYAVSADLTPHLAKAVGLAARVQGQRRYYAILLVDEGGRRVARLVKMRDRETTLAETEFAWQWDSAQAYALSLVARGNTIRATIDGVTLTATDPADPLETGGIALVLEEGRAAWGPVTIGPAE